MGVGIRIGREHFRTFSVDQSLTVILNEATVDATFGLGGA
jgi:hypothetical protein